MEQKISSLVAALKTTDAFGIANAADFPATGLGGQQFALVHTFITNAAHSLVLLGNPTIGGKFLMPHSNGDQALLNSARAFAADSVAFSAALISVGLPATFITTLNADITAFEGLITTKGTALTGQAGATGGLENAAHQAAVALHVLKTIVPNTYKNNPVKLAAWATASHVEKHTPVPRPPKPAAAPAK